MWQARFLQALPKLIEKEPSARWLFLTLTVRNCDIGNLGATLTTMNAAWNRLSNRGIFKPKPGNGRSRILPNGTLNEWHKEFIGPVKPEALVKGWIRTTEVTRGADGSAHPHFHVLMAVPSSYFKGDNYISHEKWVEIWRESLRVNYDPNVDIRTVKSKLAPGDDPANFLRSAVAETLKYSVKPSDMIDDPNWFLELTRQVHRKRFMATGGILKDLLKSEDDIDDEDLLVRTEADADDDGSRTAYAWNNGKRQYRRSRKHDKEATTEGRE